MKSSRAGSPGEGFTLCKALPGLIERLHFVGTQRDKAGNRDLKDSPANGTSATVFGLMSHS